MVIVLGNTIEILFSVLTITVTPNMFCNAVCNLATR